LRLLPFAPIGSVVITAVSLWRRQLDNALACTDELYLHDCRAPLDFFTGVVGRVREVDWEKPSPCTGWRMLDVLGDVGMAVRFGTQLVRDGKAPWEPVQPPGAAVRASPGEWWTSLVGPAREAVAGADLSQVLDSPVGRRTIGEGLSFPALDLFVHAWDIGRGAGIEVEAPVEAIEFAYAMLDSIPAEQLRNPRVFAAEVATAPDAPASRAFIAWTGRDPDWTPPA
jgi:uncharacterized protein (TIGR03086 family)